MIKSTLIARFPKIYSLLANLKTHPNYEKILYLNYIKRNNTVFDLGANFGYFTSLFSDIVGKNGFVHAFEPVSLTFRELHKNTIRKKNITFNKMAVGKRLCKKEIRFTEKDLGKSSIVENVPHSWKKELINIIPLDNYCDQNKIKEIDFIKCDVEGYELDVVQGMGLSLQKHSPQLSIEVTVTGHKRKLLLELLKELGYKNFRTIDRYFPKLDEEQYLNTDSYFYLHATT